MNISKRIKSTSESPIRKLTPYAIAAKAKGKKVYHLNIGQPDIKTPSSFMDSIRNFNEETIAYANSNGEMFLIKAVQEYYKSYGMNYDVSDILITNGGSEALQFAIMAVCDPGDEILIPEPYYANYSTFSLSYNVNVTPIVTKAEDGFHLPSEEDIQSRITPKTRAIIITNPGNPTGTVFTKEELDMVGRLAVKNDLAIIADEVYREFIYGDEKANYRSFGQMPELDDRVIITDSVSKRYSACGARIGSIACKNKEFIKQVIKLCQARLCVPTLEQVGAAALYHTPQSYFEEVNTEYKNRRDALYAALKDIPGIVCREPKGAFYMMLKMPVDDAEKFAIWMLESFDVNGETVMFAPGNGFYYTEGLGKDEGRLAYVLNCEDLKKAASILKAGLAQYPGRTI